MQKIKDLLDSLDQELKKIEPIDNKDFSLDKIKENISIYSTKKIADMLVSNRYLFKNKEFEQFLMQELSNRRLNGDDFQFEDYIEKETKSMPDFSQITKKQFFNIK